MLQKYKIFTIYAFLSRNIRHFGMYINDLGTFYFENYPYLCSRKIGNNII